MSSFICISLLFLEISIRTYLTYKHFNNPHVNYWEKLGINPDGPNIRLEFIKN